MKIVFTIQEKNFYDSNKGDCFDILGHKTFLLAASSLLRSFSDNTDLFLYVPNNIYKEFSTPPSDQIKIRERSNKSFIECLHDTTSNHSRSDEDIIWINTRFIGFKPVDILKAIKFKKEKSLDLVFSCDEQIFFTKFNKEFNIDSNFVDNLPFFDRKRLTKSCFFDRKLLIITHSMINKLLDPSLLNFDFFPLESGISIDKLLKVFPEEVIANLYLS